MKEKKEKLALDWKPAQLKRADMFFWWMRERHRMYVLKEIKKLKFPWTKNQILRQYKFTNVFRQLDRMTREWNKRYVHLRAKNISDADLLFRLCEFRFFNWAPTYDALYYGLGSKWDEKAAIKILKDRINSGDDEKKQIFTGAYIIPNAGEERPKVEVICEALTWVWEHRKELTKRIHKEPSLEKTVNILQNIWTVGPFIAYEIACDLRFTRLLHDASDRNSWANAGPGAKRGIHRILSGSKDRMEEKPDYVKAMRDLLVMAKRPGNMSKSMLECEWPFEMREIEHSLCEFDKYLRVKKGEGRPRSRYQPWRWDNVVED